MTKYTEIYKIAMNQIWDARTPYERIHAQITGIEELAYQYNIIDSETSKSEIRTLIGKLDMIDRESNIKGSERRMYVLDG